MESYTEWANATYFKTGKGKEAGKLVPESCCDSDKLKENKEECQVRFTTHTSVSHTKKDKRVYLIYF